jgi:type I restriction enzyme S subunit
MTYATKDSPVGSIPLEWNCDLLGKFVDVTKLAGFEYTLHFDYKKSGPIVAVRGVNIKKGGLDLTDVHTIPQKTSEQLPRSKLFKNDLVMSYVGTLGRVAIIPEDDRYHLAPNVAKLSIKGGFFEPGFLLYYLNGPRGQRSIFEASASTTQAALSMRNLRSIFVTAPPINEQRLISESLSDIDNLIFGLEKLISKKRDLKQAAMQQLLTGQTRLPGFSGEWVSRSLGSLGMIYGGLVGKSKADFGHGSATYVPFVNVMANIRIDCGALEPVNVASTENQNRVFCGDLLFNGSSETPEEVALCALMTQTVEDLYLNSFCFGFRFKQGAEASGLFLTYLMRSQMGRELMKSLAQGSTRYNLSKSALLQATLVLPNLEEQTAIATVLSDMDADLSAVEARLAKTRDLKQGMMQELLTGLTRLV